MRLGCFLVTFAVLASLVLEPPRAKAEALTLAAVGGTALVAAYLGACGMMPYTTGMDRNGVNESVARMIQDFLDDTFSGGDEPSGGGNKPSLNDWLGMIAFTVSNGVVRFGKEAADKLNQFAQWVAGKYGTKPGVNVVYGGVGDYAVLANGEKFYFSVAEKVGSDFYDWKIISPGTIISASTEPFVFPSGCSVDFRKEEDDKWYFRPLDPTGKVVTDYRSVPSSSKFCYVRSVGGVVGTIGFNSLIGFRLDSNSQEWRSLGGLESPGKGFDYGGVISADESLTLDVSDTMQEVLDRLTALEEGQSIALDVGATQSMEIQEILQGILDAILAGDLAASAEIVDTAEIPVDPEEPDPPVVPVVPSGLDKLGAALTSRFPFSIPWDVYKGVTLLAAPPKAPYFEVDFLEPIGHLVGGWQGSTKIVLDMSEYEIIGQVCRWTSTIGFCLMLAIGTKRLIWTA